MRSDTKMELPTVDFVRRDKWGARLCTAKTESGELCGTRAERGNDGKIDKCIQHGGGNRCTEPGCTKSARGKTDKCKRHGGGKRCTEPGCTKSALGKTDKCARHGGGKRCTEPGCTKGAEGKTDKCIQHGGGKRCARLDVHQFDEFPPVMYTSVDGVQLCHSCFSHLYPSAASTSKVRREHLFLAEIQRQIPALEPYFHSWDCPIDGACGNAYRPDMLWDFKLWYLQIEIDEDQVNHEQCKKRLRTINKQMGSRPGVVVRIDTKGFVGRRRKRDGSYYWRGNKHFSDDVGEVCEWIKENLPLRCAPCRLAKARNPRRVTCYITSTRS